MRHNQSVSNPNYGMLLALPGYSVSSQCLSSSCQGVYTRSVRKVSDRIFLCEQLMDQLASFYKAQNDSCTIRSHPNAIPF